MKITVTAEDIARAHVKDSVRCVVVQAIKRTVEGAQRIEVDLAAIRFTVGDERFIYLTPYSVQQYIVRFDRGDVLEPWAFMLTERNRVVVQVKRQTAAGKAVKRAKDRKASADRKVRELERSKAPGITKARATAKQAAQALEQARATQQGPTAVRKGKGQANPLPRADRVVRAKPDRSMPAAGPRSNRRVYGVRALIP